LAGADLAVPASEEPATYLQALVGLTRSVDVWETTYLQVLPGEDAVVQWMRGTGLGPVLTELDEEEGEEFLTAYRSLVATAYPQRPWGTVLPYRRIFAVAQR
jgi:trans-aconitate 2-methyltransferase